MAGFAVIRVSAGEPTRVRIYVRRRALAHWDRQWAYEPGDYRLSVGTSVDRLFGDLTTWI